MSECRHCWMQDEKEKAPRFVPESRGRIKKKSTHSANISEEINRASFGLGSRATHSWSANLLREQFRNRAFRERSCNHFLYKCAKFSTIRIAGLFSLPRSCCKNVYEHDKEKQIFLSLYLPLSKFLPKYISHSVSLLNG